MKQNENSRRARLFLMFDPFKGYKELLRQKERIIVPKKELSPDDEYELNWKINSIEPGMMVGVVYYDNDDYVFVRGMVSRIDLNYKKTIQIVNKVIFINNIVKIDI